jgi:circadian clock protein KaiC
LHTFRITHDGLQAFPRNFGLTGRRERGRDRPRLSSGIAELDAMMGGGIPEGDSVLVAGPSGCGKSVFATQFIAEGLRRGESAIAAIFEERPEEYADRASALGMNFDEPQAEGRLCILYLRPLDLSVDETTREIVDAVTRTGAKRLVIDSLAGFELALAPGFRADFRESLYRMIGALTRTGVTIVSTVEVVEKFTELEFSPYAISFLSDDILRMRYVEIDGELRKVLVVVKMRAGPHSREIREYQVVPSGLEIGERIQGYTGLVTGVPTPKAKR